MKKRLQFLFGICAILFAFSSSGQGFVGVTKSNSGQTITLFPDQVLEIKLPRIPSTGYIWCESTASNDKTSQRSIAQVGDCDFLPDANIKTVKGRKIIGLSGTQIIRYVGASQGTISLTLELRRPWEKNNPPIDSYTITVVSIGKYSGNYAPSTKKELSKHMTSTPKGVPSKWDWRLHCAPIANQMQCGDCWAFAGVGVLECNILIHDGITRDISEKYLTDCDIDYFGCNGGGCPLDYWMAPKGAVYETDDPWTTSEGNGTAGTCAGPYTYHETINSWAYIPSENAQGIPPDANMKNAIYNYGPIWVAVDASSSAWQTYTGGIFTESDTSTDHAVCLVGWCDSTGVSGGGYWILRNSWDSSWGINGYMYMSYGSDAVGTDAAYMEYKCANNDLEMIDITSPITACGHSNAEPISARLRNNGCNAISSGDKVPVAYSADGGAIVNDTITLAYPLNKGDTLSFIFPSAADFSAIGTHTINCWVKYKNDTLALNDSITGYTFINKLHQNTDVGVIKITAPVSSCNMGNAEHIKIDIGFYGCDSLAKGSKIAVAYRLNGGSPLRDTIILSQNIMPNDTFTHTFSSTINLSAPGSYKIDAWTEYNLDTQKSNDSLLGYMIKYPASIGFDTIGFEESNINNIALIETARYSHALVSAAAQHTGGKGFQMTGGNAMTYLNDIQFPDSTNIWTVNDLVSAKLSFCVDATNWSTANMRFDLKQTDGGAIYTMYMGAGDYTKASSLRILVNGTQIGGTYNPNTNGSDPWATHYINLNSYAGQIFQVTFETRNISKDTLSYKMDNAYIDNVCFSPLSENSVPEYSTILSFDVYPNPFNDAFTLKFDADRNETISLVITDMLGNIINSRNWNVTPGSNRLNIGLGSLSAGMYMIKLTSSKGFAVKNVVKQ
jgi:C1A family cysteine protease